jgi:protein TonB
MRVIASLILWVATVAPALSAQDAPKKVSQQVATSAALTKVEPEYPPVAKQLRLQGKVDLEAVVDEHGYVVKVDTIAGNPILARAATEALKQWKFKPFVEDGKVMKVTAPISFSFNR